MTFDEARRNHGTRNELLEFTTDRFALGRAVQELWDIHGTGAFEAATERAKAADHLGQAKLAREWREIAEACKKFRKPPSSNE